MNKRFPRVGWLILAIAMVPVASAIYLLIYNGTPYNSGYGPGFMMGGSYPGFLYFMPLAAGISMILIFLFLFFLFRAPEERAGYLPMSGTPDELLRRRLANGDISMEDYDRLKEKLLR